VANEASKKITQEGIAREIATLDIVLAAKVGRTALTLEEYIRVRHAQGATLEIIRADLLTDLEEGGRIFGEFINALKPTFGGSIHRFRDIGVLAENGAKQKYRWVAVLVNTCPDCLDRHNKIKDAGLDDQLFIVRRNYSRNVGMFIDVLGALLFAFCQFLRNYADYPHQKPEKETWTKKTAECFHLFFASIVFLIPSSRFIFCFQPSFLILARSGWRDW